MGSNRRKYDKEFKLEAIRSYENGDRSQSEVERELGITPGLLGKWTIERDTVLDGEGSILFHRDEDRFFVYHAHAIVSSGLCSVYL